MNVLCEWLEKILAGPVVESIDLPMLDFRNGRIFTGRHLMEGTLVLGSIGKGKTTLSKTVLHGMLTHGFGGLVLCVKGSQIAEAVAACERAGRARGCIVFAPGSGYVFNPFENAQTSSEAADLLVELVDVVRGSNRPGGEDSVFWTQQSRIMLRSLMALCYAYARGYDANIAAELFSNRAESSARLSDPVWQGGPMAKALKRAKEMGENIEMRLAYEYFEKEYPIKGDRLQGSLSSMVSAVFDDLMRPPLRELLTGKSNVSMEDFLEGGKVLIVGLPVLDTPTVGRLANGLFQFCFCKEALRKKRESCSFLMSDECQETVTGELMRKLAVMREYRIAPVLLTQNLAVLDDRIGATTREALCGLLTNKIFCTQSHADTRNWAAEQVGKVKVKKETENKGYSSGNAGGGSNRSTSVHEEWEYRAQPTRFAELAVGETICLRDGDSWRCRWHKNKFGKGSTVEVL